jgi:hypothetical protein
MAFRHRAVPDSEPGSERVPDSQQGNSGGAVTRINPD